MVLCSIWLQICCPFTIIYSLLMCLFFCVRYFGFYSFYLYCYILLHTSVLSSASLIIIIIRRLIRRRNMSIKGAVRSDAVLYVGCPRLLVVSTACIHIAATSDPVSTKMVDSLWAGKPSWYVTSHPGGRGIWKKNCLCATVLCTIIMVHKDTSSSYGSVDCIGL